MRRISQHCCTAIGSSCVSGGVAENSSSIQHCYACPENPQSPKIIAYAGRNSTGGHHGQAVAFHRFLIRGSGLARAVRALLDRDVEASLWNEGFFKLGSTFIETLVNSIARFDFAVLLLTPDDW